MEMPTCREKTGGGKQSSACVFEHRRVGERKTWGAGGGAYLEELFLKSSPDAVWNLPTEGKQSLHNHLLSCSFSHTSTESEWFL